MSTGLFGTPTACQQCGGVDCSNVDLQPFGVTITGFIPAGITPPKVDDTLGKGCRDYWSTWRTWWQHYLANSNPFGQIPAGQ